MPTIRELLRDAAAAPREPLDWAECAGWAAGVRWPGESVRPRWRSSWSAPASRWSSAPGLVWGHRPRRRRRWWSQRRRNPTARPPSPGPFDDLPTGWTSLPAPPEVRLHAATQWTGQTLLIWGGTVPAETAVPKSDGMAVTPGASTWTEMAPSPLSPRTYPARPGPGRRCSGVATAATGPDRPTRSAVCVDR